VKIDIEGGEPQLREALLALGGARAVVLHRVFPVCAVR
jgi:hypothetical protein